MICYILPGAFYLGLKKGEPWYFTKVLFFLMSYFDSILVTTLLSLADLDMMTIGRGRSWLWYRWWLE